MYRNLASHIEGVRDEVLGTRRELQAMIRALDPELAQNLGLPPKPERETDQVNIPDDIKHGLDHAFNLHPDRGRQGPNHYPPLRDMADAFVGSFDMSTRSFEPARGNNEPPVAGYLALLTCQFLMTKILESPELGESPEYSHWPGYIRSLQKVPDPLFLLTAAVSAPA
jgi:hypothetical protein